jgi:hypothetical protein
MTQSPAREARIRMISEGVVASYIHDISTRTSAQESRNRGIEIAALGGHDGSRLGGGLWVTRRPGRRPRAGGRGAPGRRAAREDQAVRA